MRSHPGVRLILPAVLVILGFTPLVSASPGPLRLVTSDARGVTLELRLGDIELVPAGRGGRMRVVVPGLGAANVQGRPLLPYSHALLALPPGARAVARLLEGGAEETRDGVRLAVGDKPVFHSEPGGLGEVPGYEPVDPIRDGAWPATTVDLGAPFQLRGQRLVAVEIHPFRYDEASARLWTRRTLTVRVDFVGGTASTALPAGEDRYFEPVLAATVLNYAQGRAWRSSPTPASHFEPSRLGARPGRGAESARVRSAELHDKPEVRIKIDTTGVYSLDFDALAANGYPAGDSIQFVEVHRHEFLENSVPPYQVIQLPIEVDDTNGNKIFDSGDRIIVYVQSWAERSGASFAQRAWGDAEAIFASVDFSSNAPRVATRPGWLNDVGLTPLGSYPWTQRWERNFSYTGFLPDTSYDQFTWSEISLYYDRPDSIKFATNHIDTTHAASFSVTWQGRKFNSHYMWAQVKNRQNQFTTVADSVSWFGKEPLTATTSITGSALSEGNFNTFRMWGKTNPGPPDMTTNNTVNVGLNYFDLTYWRRYRALYGYLWCNSGGAAGDYQIQAQGFPDTLFRIYDLSDPQNPTRLMVDRSHITGPVNSEYSIEFQDNATPLAQRRYAVFRDPKPVASDHYFPVTHRTLYAHAGGDYLMIVPEAFLPAVGPLVTLRQNQGLNVVLAPLESVNDEFNGGRKSSYSIKRFVRYAYNNWGTKFVLLVGDGSEDPQQYFWDSSPDWIPTQKIRGPVPVSEGLELVPGDPWYVCINGPCDPISGISPPGVPSFQQDLFLGRLPVHDLRNCTDYVNKLVAYENFDASQAWRHSVLLVSDDAYSGETTFGGGGGGSNNYCHKDYEERFRLLNDRIHDVILNDAGLREMNVDQFNLSYYLRNLPTTCCTPDTCRLDRAAAQSYTHANVTPILISKLNSGQLWWNYQGHANEYVLTHEDLYINSGSEDDKDQLTNVGKPFLFSAFSCHVNSFGRTSENSGKGPCIGEDLVDLPSRGAIAAWASVGFEIVPSANLDHINVTQAQYMFSNPPHDEYLGDHGSRVVLGEVINAALLDYTSRSYVLSNSFERGIGLTYTLLGDPATRLSIGAPETMVMANGDSVQSGLVIRLHTPGDSLRLVADLVSSVRLDSLKLLRVDATRSDTIPAGRFTLSPAFPDTGSGQNGGRRFRLTYLDTLQADSFTYRFLTWDRYHLQSSFDAHFDLAVVLRAEGTTINPGDAVAPSANLSLLVLSPRPLVPASELALTINGAVQSFTAQANPGDVSGREWILSWSHGPYPIDTYNVQLAAAGGATRTSSFRVLVGGNELKLDNAFVFPNPFDDDLGAFFSFTLVAGGPADLLIRVFTEAGHLVYARVEKGLNPGYHQIAWDGRDAESQKLANGVYFYRMIATNGASHTVQQGRIVKLRKPRRLVEPAAP